jgi:hypothetical protein
MRNACEISVENPEGRLLGTPRRVRGVNITIYL